MTTLVIRLSSLGDVAILIPVLYSVAKRYPGDRFCLLTKPGCSAIGVNAPENLTIIPIDTQSKHQGLKGILRLIRELPVPNKVADMHNVLRSQVIGRYFRCKGAQVAVIDKGRKDKRALVRRNHKRLVQLTTSLQRYQQVFDDLGYDASLDFVSLFSEKQKHNGSRIGLAPFAKHPGKIYPVEKMEEVVRLLDQRPDTTIYLFGGKDDHRVLQTWAEKYKSVESVAGQLTFPEEIRLMNNLDVMVSMDSANMHLASLVRTPVVSIWGATHPFAGFYGFGQRSEDALQVDLPCRPCSIFGNKPCYRGDFACMRQLTPTQIVEKITAHLS